jgi:uncharacterized protein YegL
MKKDLTYISVVLDESSSMSIARSATIEGMNTFFTEQAKRPGEAKLTLVKFASEVREPVYIDRPIGQVEPLNLNTYVPNGMTALYDAIGQTIDLTGVRLAEMPEAERPEQVLIVIQTDGEENQSYKYSLEKIQSMIKHQKDVYNWDFIFMGQGIDSFAVSKNLGINAKSTFDFSSLSAKNAYAVMDSYIGVARSVGHMNTSLSQADRTKAMTPDAP